MLHEQAVAEAFVALADIDRDEVTEADYLVDAARRLEQVLDVGLVALLLASPEGGLHPAAPRAGSVLRLVELACQDSPALQAYHTAQAVGPVALTRVTPRWPAFTATAHAAGYRTARAVPLRYRHQVSGSVLLCGGARSVPDADIRLAQSLADAVAIGLFTQRLLRQHTGHVTQLQTALDSRTVIEQAKGILAARHEISPHEAFALLRGHARSHQQRLADVAAHVLVAHALPAAPVAADPAGPADDHPARQPGRPTVGRPRPAGGARSGAGRGEGPAPAPVP